jgi:hypothetical protein
MHLITSVIPTLGKVNSILFSEGNYIVGVSCNKVVTYTSSGKVISEIKTSSRSIRNVTKLDIHKRKVICLSGDSSYLDIFSQGAGSDILFKLIY